MITIRKKLQSTSACLNVRYSLKLRVVTNQYPTLLTFQQCLMAESR